MDILDSINYLLEKILKACSYSPKVSRIPIVSSTITIKEFYLNKFMFLSLILLQLFF